MAFRYLSELLQEGLEAVATNGYFSACDTLLENIELVISELDRDESSPIFVNVISDLRRACDLIQNLNDRPPERSNGRPRLHIPRYTLRYLLLTLNFKVSDITKIFAVSRTTIDGRLAEMGLSVNDYFLKWAPLNVILHHANFIYNYRPLLRTPKLTTLNCVLKCKVFWLLTRIPDISV